MTTNEAPLVSIIIPAYNTSPYVHRAIESSLRQTHTNVEVLVVDDGSTDDTLKVAREYAGRDERVRVFTQENAGVSSARNHGIREAHGDYLYFLDADDWLEDDAIATLIEAQSKFPDKLISANYYKVRQKDGRFLRSYLNNPGIPSHLMTEEEFIVNFGGIGTLGQLHSNTTILYKADCGLTFRVDIHYSEDGIYTLEYYQMMTGAYYVSKAILNVFISGNSLTRSASYRPVMLDSQVAAYDILQDKVKHSPALLEIMTISRALLLVLPLTWSLGRGAPSSEVRRARKALKPCLPHYLHSSRIKTSRKILTLLKFCLPIPVSRLVVRLWNITRKFKNNKKRDNEEVIPIW